MLKHIGRTLAILIALLLFVLAGVVYFLLLGQWHGTSYAAGKTNLVKVYRFEDHEPHNLVEAGSVIRGSEVTSYQETVTIDGVKYRKVVADLAAEEREQDEKEPDSAEDSTSDSTSENSADSTSDDPSGNTSDGTDGDSEDVTEEPYGEGLSPIQLIVHWLGSLKQGAPEFLSHVKHDSEELITQLRLRYEGENLYEGLYIEDASLVDSAGETVLEREVYVRTPATIYEDHDSPAIASFAPKGTHLDIIGHDDLLDNGYINMYKVRYEDRKGKPAEGYIYGKYTTDTQEAADAPYNEHGEYDKARKDKYGINLYGGKAENLDYYPYEKTEIEGNEFCGYAKAMYLNAYAATHPEQYVRLIEKSNCNAVVIDIKDGPLTYKSRTAKELSPTSYKNAYYSAEELKKGVDAYRETGVYLIGRIVTFNDPYYAKDHPKDCIKYGGNSGWPSAFSRNVWEYNVRLAQEAAEEFGFNEIQFDYVRFPEATYEMSRSGNADFRNKYDESKAQAIQNFCFYAADQLRESGVYISVDVFGESAYSYVTAYGQYWPAISNIVDAISAMPYTDHFDGNNPWEHPYSVVNSWAKKAAGKQKRLQDPAVARTWITGYDTPHWAPAVNYDRKRLEDQIRALEDAGLDGGFIPWNALSDIGKYKQYKGIWK